MSAPLRLTAWQVARLAEALETLTEMTRKTRVRIDAYGAVPVRIGDDAALDVVWDEEDRHYVIDDRVGAS